MTIKNCETRHVYIYIYTYVAIPQASWLNEIHIYVQYISIAVIETKTKKKMTF